MHSPVVNLWIILGGDLGDVASVQKGPTHVTFLLNFFDELRRARRWVESRIPPGFPSCGLARIGFPDWINSETALPVAQLDQSSTVPMS